jgi:hypothetical protein
VDLIPWVRLRRRSAGAGLAAFVAVNDTASVRARGVRSKRTPCSLSQAAGQQRTGRSPYSQRLGRRRLRRRHRRRGRVSILTNSDLHRQARARINKKRLQRPREPDVAQRTVRSRFRRARRGAVCSVIPPHGGRIGIRLDGVAPGEESCGSDAATGFPTPLRGTIMRISRGQNRRRILRPRSTFYMPPSPGACTGANPGHSGMSSRCTWPRYFLASTANGQGPKRGAYDELIT